MSVALHGRPRLCPLPSASVLGCYRCALPSAWEEGKTNPFLNAPSSGPLGADTDPVLDAVEKTPCGGAGIVGIPA